MNIDFESRNITRRSFLKGAGVVGAAGLLSACGGSKSNNSGSTAASGAEAPNSTGATPLKEYISWESANREIESWNLLYSQTLSDANVVTNLWDGLMSFDCYGKLVPAIATSWEANEDSTVWTFHLRDDVDWVDCNGEVKEHITATDFLVGLEWVLNASKNEANNTSMPTLYIVGAEEYYEKTKDMGAAAADLHYQDMLDAGVGLEAPDDYQKDLMDAFEQYTDLVNAANAIVNDTDARYEAFAKAEAYMLENVLVSPTYYDIAWSLTHANEYSKINAMYGGCNYKAVNWETSEEAYTTVQYEQFAKAFDAAIQG